MNVLYVSCTCSNEKFIQYVESKGARGSQQAQKYNLLLAEGLAKNSARVTMISSRPINRELEKRLWMRREREQVNGVDFHYLPFVNYPVLRNIWILFGTFFAVLFLKCSKKETAIVCDALNISAAMGALTGAFFRRFSTVAIVTDVPGVLSYATKITLAQKLNLAVIRRFKSYLLLTKQMSEIVNPKNQPYIVLEGHADEAMAHMENTLAGKAEKKIVMYAGSLMEIYGIGNLVEGFLAANIPGAELHIYGDGDYAEKLEKKAAENSAIKYHGVAPNSEIVKAELAATLLVNPRPSHEEYTKYSFPSKNMEYMASGTPVLTTRLPGMPEDHKPYVYFIEREDAEGIKVAIQCVLAQNAKRLHEFGLQAKDFVLNQKNNVEQAKKLMFFLKQIGEMENNNRG